VRESAGSSQPLSPKDEALALELARGKTRVEAAKAMGLGERTVYTKLARPEFSRRVRDLRAEFIGDAVGRLTEASTAAADTLKELLAPEVAPTVRLGAARAVLADLVSLAFHQSVEERLLEVERRLGDRPRPRVVPGSRPPLPLPAVAVAKRKALP
jgi:hypothetical protein